MDTERAGTLAGLLGRLGTRRGVAAAALAGALAATGADAGKKGKKKKKRKCLRSGRLWCGGAVPGRGLGAPVRHRQLRHRGRAVRRAKRHGAERGRADALRARHREPPGFGLGPQLPAVGRGPAVGWSRADGAGPGPACVPARRFPGGGDPRAAVATG